MNAALSTHRSLHPVLWVAAVAVTLLAVTGIAAITGLIPSSRSADASTIPQPTPASSSVAALAAATPAPAPQKIVKHVAPTARRHAKPEQIARAEEPIPQPAPPAPAAICSDCGRIESVQRIEREGDGSGIGAIAGGVAGGALGNNVGRGNGRTVATIAGLIGGAMLGNKIEKSQKKTVSYQTVVRFEDGSSRVFNSATAPYWEGGERVRVTNGVIQPL